MQHHYLSLSHTHCRIIFLGKIARMKQSVGQTGTQYNVVTTEFNEMFGGTSPRPAWHWFVPIPVRFPGAMKHVVLGYDYHESYSPVAYEEGDEEAGMSGGAGTLECSPASGDDGLSDAPRRRAPSREGIALSTLS